MSESQFQTILSAIQEIDVKVGSFGDRLDNIEDRIDKIEERLDKVDGRLDKVEGLLVGINGELKRIEYWTPYNANEDIVAKLEAIKAR